MSVASLRTKLAAAAATVTLALGTGVLAAGPAQADSSFGCPSGAVCVYLGTDWNQPVPQSQMYWSAGVHRLYNQEGRHIVYNNQTHGWTVRLCRNGNGTDCGPKMRPGDGWPENLSPVNSLLIASS
ncbi:MULTISPECIES: hypothetical protein [Streptomyces]|uniref:hypothetical protein n=1 Tax=Streptomyces TaxID=1883 RepID=UPI0004BD6B39|nr:MULTISPECIES: hypothetical protein [Streptomyces]KOU27066.1 hypothetical protein ADK49_00835 [Streptomyces sp. WM6349]KOU94863.1 hypothetical protein ADK94_01685 [Streptomyces sp. XY593]KOV17743.1 hypothetical protein ADK91_00630 [Streptomyces sp. XY511]KOV55237.1 hypothetical protein ADK98_00835 [Streptomyces sp. H036]MBP2345353.1 hypothetical protein [Streptomyces virginiae]